MCAVAVAAAGSVRLRFSAARQNFPTGPFKVGTRQCQFLSVATSHQVRAEAWASQGLVGRTHNRDYLQIRGLQQCRAQVDEEGTIDNDLPTYSSKSFTGEDKETFLERLVRAWSILFPSKLKPSSNAEIAKQRLKMILFSDRCSVNDEAKRKIVNNIVGALSDFVEIESEEKVQLNVTSDPDLGTVYSVTVPVRRVRPEYQEFSKELVNTQLRAFDYEEEEGNFRMVDIRFEHPDVQDVKDGKS